MNRITKTTKRDIYNLFKVGVEVDNSLFVEIVYYPYFGKLSEIEFLERLYNLKEIPSNNEAHENAYDEILYNTIKNNYPRCWVFEDERFYLKDGSDEIYLKFICEIFHRKVRDRNGCWRQCLKQVGKLLQKDGYEIVPARNKNNRGSYIWRVCKENSSDIFNPYSKRNAEKIKNKEIELKISRDGTFQIYKLLERYIKMYSDIDETSYHYNISITEAVFNDIKQFYVPKCYNDKSQYVETIDLKNFIMFTSPFCVLDTIEFFEKRLNSEDFNIEINELLKRNKLDLKLENGKIKNTLPIKKTEKKYIKIQDIPLTNLLDEAAKHYDENHLSLAFEKLWDAFEILKAYYSPKLDKKNSVAKIVHDMASGEESFIEIFNKEFAELTALGNTYCIQCHETTKIKIEDERHYEYLYKRCLSLIVTATKYLEERG